MSRESVATFVIWLEEKPQTMGWDAILAYDQSKTNTLLIQEYFQRFDNGQYFEPLTFLVEYSSSHWDYLYDYVLDAPRLSFETASITGAEATLTMRIVGGTQLTLNQGVGKRVKAVSRMRLADAVNGPLLGMTIQLRDKPGTEDTLGSVMLDLSEGTEMYVTVGDSMEEDLIAGEKFQRLFNKWPEEKKVFELNTLTRQPADLLQPDKFFIRTHPAPGGNIRTAPNFGEGEVLVFIQMKGGAADTEVAFPPSDDGMHYLIPQGGGDEPLSATILLGNHFLLNKIVAEGFKLINKGEPIEVIPESMNGGHIQSLKPSGGIYKGPEPAQTDVPHIKSLELPSGFTLPFSKKEASTEGCEFLAKINKDILSLRWEGTQPTPLKVVVNDNYSVTCDVTVKWRWQESFKFTTTADGELSLKPVLDPDAENLKICKVSPDDFIGNPQVEPHIGPILECIELLLKERLEANFDLFTSTVDDINAFRLNGLLFRTQNAVVPTYGYFTGDLALLGKIAPSLTNFVINPIEPVIGPLGAISFVTEPAAVGVAWSVMNLPGEPDEDPGIIDADTGRYVAPSDANIFGYQKRVLVTAKAGNGNTSSALVSIVKRDIGIDPLVFVVTARSEGEQVLGHKMSAAVLDGTALSWKLASGSTAELKEEPEPTLGLESQKRFIPPLRQGDAAITLEEIEVSRVSGGPVQKSIAVVVHQSSTYFFRTETVTDSLLLKFLYLDKESNEVQVPLHQTTFTKLYGEGLFSSDGRYDPPTNPTSKFAVLMAEREDDEEWKFAYLIVPLPLVNVQNHEPLQSDEYL